MAVHRLNVLVQAWKLVGVTVSTALVSASWVAVVVGEHVVLIGYVMVVWILRWLVAVADLVAYIAVALNKLCGWLVALGG